MEGRVGPAVAPPHFQGIRGIRGIRGRIPRGYILCAGVVDRPHLLGKRRPIFNKIQKTAQGGPRGSYRCPKMAKGTPKDGQRGAKAPQREPKGSPRGSPRCPKTAKGTPKDSQRGPRHPKGSQREPKVAPKGAKRTQSQPTTIRLFVYYLTALITPTISYCNELCNATYYS